MSESTPVHTAAVAAWPNASIDLNAVHASAVAGELAGFTEAHLLVPEVAPVAVVIDEPVPETPPAADPPAETPPAAGPVNAKSAGK